MMPPNMMNVPPQMVPPPQHNLNIIGPPGLPPMMPPPVMNPQIPPNRVVGVAGVNDDHRNKPPMDKRNEAAPPQAWRSRETRDKERDYRERDRGNYITAKKDWQFINPFKFQLDEESPSDRERRRERERYRSDRDRGPSRR